MSAFGIHFGSTSACIAVCKDGKADVVANDAGDRTTPAIVAFTDHDQGVGLAAKQGLIRNAANTICNAKQMIGRSFDDPFVQTVKARCQVKVVKKNEEVAYEVLYKEKQKMFTALEIASIIYKKMMETAESHGGAANSHDAVITVPLHFNDKQKNATRMAATAAGFRVMRVISEPSAAVLAYDLGQPDQRHESMNVLVYRLGGASMDATIVNVSSGMYHIVEDITDTSVGGNMAEELIIENYVEEFKRKWKSDCRENKRSIAKLRNAAQSCKHILSTMGSAQCSVDSLYDGIDFQATLSRSRFEALCSNLFEQCLQPLAALFEKANLTKSDIHKVILCGGATNIPYLQRLITDYFPEAEILSRLNPDEVLAIGASKQASIVSGQEMSASKENATDTTVPSLSVSLLLKVIGDPSAYVTVLPAHTPLPTRRQHRTHLADGQTSMKLELYARDKPESEPQPLGKLVLEELPEAAEIMVVFHGRNDGSIHVVCTEATSNKSDEITIETS